MDLAGPPPIFSCSHPVSLPESPLPLTTEPPSFPFPTTNKNSYTAPSIPGLCKQCHFAKCAEKHALLKEHWTGKLEDLRREIARAKSRLWYQWEERLARWTDEAQKKYEAWVYTMNLELRQVWVELERRWGVWSGDHGRNVMVR